MQEADIVKARLVAALSESGYSLLHTAGPKRGQWHGSDYEIWGKDDHPAIIIEDEDYGHVFFESSFPAVKDSDIEAIVKRIRTGIL